MRQQIDGAPDKSGRIRTAAGSVRAEGNGSRARDSWQRVAGLHLVFIGGFTLVSFTVATRVVLGHTGLGHLVAEPLVFLRTTIVLLLTAAAFRIIGDFFVTTRGTLLDVASYAWIASAFIWSWRILRRVRIPDAEMV